MTNNIFALDIGTHSVTGIILKKDSNTDTYTVIDFCTKEHKERSMLDGQIHDVVSVARVIKEVKEQLEKSHGKLHSVSVAAAGRALKTIHGTSVLQLKQQPIVDKETITFLELSAVQDAQINLAKKEEINEYTNYYCVGYSTLNYKLDHEIIGSLIDQNGEEASAEVIATFLPKVVVESLLAALNRAQLEMEALTLEPIAAINVLIPESMRRLNIALVDIGAGTSDIAITNKGTVIAYGMVPIAGDKVTEAISDYYLLDFPMAEKTKRNIVLNGQDKIEDVLGFETTVTYKELVENITDSIQSLAGELAHEIIQLNQQAPRAVMLVGGGSLTPEITSALANKLQLPTNRVAVRGIDAIQSLNKNESLPTGPEFVTPIGIAIAAKQNPVHYISVKVNGKLIRMFEMKQLTIGDCLVQAGIEFNKLYGKPGLASIVTVDDQVMTLPGEYGKAPLLYLNGETSNVKNEIHNGDEIIVKRGLDGTAPRVKIHDIVGHEPPLSVHYNGDKYELKPIYYANQHVVNENYLLKDNDVIVINHIRTLNDFFTHVVKQEISEMKPFSLFINERKVTMPSGRTKVLVNHKHKALDYTLYNQDNIEIIDVNVPTLHDVLIQENMSYWHTVRVSFNGKAVTLKQPQLTITRNGEELSLTTQIKPNDRLEITPRKTQPFIFQDVFRYVDIDLTAIRGTFHIIKNDHPATFYEEIMTGDQLQITWD